MLTLLLALGANAADQASGDLATRIKNGLLVRAPKHDGVRIESVHLFSWVVQMPADDLRAALVEPLQVGTVLTKSHGRLRLTCQDDSCKAWLGKTELELELEDQPPVKDPRRIGR